MMPTSTETKPCGCVCSITWGTDGETLLTPCAAHARAGSPWDVPFVEQPARHVALNYHKDAFAPVALCLYCTAPLRDHSPAELRSCALEVCDA